MSIGRVVKQVKEITCAKTRGESDTRHARTARMKKIVRLCFLADFCFFSSFGGFFRPSSFFEFVGLVRVVDGCWAEPSKKSKKLKKLNKFESSKTAPRQCVGWEKPKVCAGKKFFGKKKVGIFFPAPKAKKKRKASFKGNFWREKPKFWNSPPFSL